MENSENYKPKFDPDTGLPLTDAVSEEIKSASQSISEEVAAAGQPIHPEPPFTAVGSETVSEATKAITASAPFTAVSDEVKQEAVGSSSSSYGSSAQETSAAPFSTETNSTGYQSSPYQSSQQSPFQSAPPSYQAGQSYQSSQAPYQSASPQSPYASAQNTGQQGSGIQYSNQRSGIQYSNQPNTPYGTSPVGNQAPNNTLALISMITGIVSILFIFLSGSLVLGIIGVLVGIAAIVTGTMALKQIKTVPASNSSKGMAIAGIICGAVGLVLSLIITIACAACYASLGGITRDAFDSFGNFNY